MAGVNVNESQCEAISKDRTWRHGSSVNLHVGWHTMMIGACEKMVPNLAIHSMNHQATGSRHAYGEHKASRKGTLSAATVELKIPFSTLFSLVCLCHRGECEFHNVVNNLDDQVPRDWERQNEMSHRGFGDSRRVGSCL